MKQLKINKTVTLILLLLILFQVGQLVLWVHQDKAPPAWDSSWHSMISVDIYNRLFHKNSYNTTQSEKSYPIFAFAKNYYPPFFHITTVISYVIFGVNYHSALLTNIFYIIILIVSSYFIGKKLDTEKAGLLLAFIVSILPIYSAVSREYLIDFALTALVAAGYCVWLYSEHFKNRRYAIAFGILSGFGMLTKWTYALFLLVPIVISAFHIAIAVIKTKKLKHLINAGIASLCAILLTILWYTPSRIQSLYPQLSTFSNRQSGAVPFWSRSTDYLYTMINGFIPILFVLFVGAAIFLLWKSIVRKKHPELIATLLITIVFVYAVFSSISNHDTRYIAPIYIFLAIITTLGIMQVGRIIPIKTQYVLVIIFVIFGIAYNVAYNKPTINIEYHVDKLPIINTAGTYPNTNPSVQGSDISNALRAMNASKNKEPYSVCIVAESPYLNDVNIPYYAMREKYPISIMYGNGCDPRAFDFVIVGEIQETWRAQTFKSSKQVLENNMRSFQNIYNATSLIVYKNRVHR